MIVACSTVSDRSGGRWCGYSPTPGVADAPNHSACTQIYLHCELTPQTVASASTGFLLLKCQHRVYWTRATIQAQGSTSCGSPVLTSDGWNSDLFVPDDFGGIWDDYIGTQPAMLSQQQRHSGSLKRLRIHLVLLNGDNFACIIWTYSENYALYIC